MNGLNIGRKIVLTHPTFSMRSISTTRTLVVSGTVFLLSGGTAALADDFTKCSVNASVSQKNEFRTDDGFTEIEDPVTEAFAGLNCGDFDAYLWGLHNNDTDRVNELDIGVGYSFVKQDFNLRIGLERWEYTEHGGRNDAFVASIGYHGLPVDLGIKVSELLDENGTKVNGSISKTLVLGDVKGVSVTLTPSVTVAYLDNYFGVSGHSNDVYGLSLNGDMDKVNFGAYVDQHDGKKDYGNSTQVGITFGYSF